MAKTHKWGQSIRIIGSTGLCFAVKSLQTSFKVFILLTGTLRKYHLPHIIVIVAPSSWFRGSPVGFRVDKYGRGEHCSHHLLTGDYKILSLFNRQPVSIFVLPLEMKVRNPITLPIIRHLLSNDSPVQQKLIYNIYFLFI